MNEKVEKVISGLREHYPIIKPGLDHDTPLQLLISTVLSAQSTDKSVNKVTEGFYKKYPDLQSLLTLEREEIEENIKEIGIYRNKSKNIYKLLRIIDEKFHGEVPSNMEDLMLLPGVGRKTASVVLAVAFEKPAFPVDTHVYRICRRIGFTKSKTPDKVSDDMMEIIPKENWIEFHHLLINHGRNICKARKAECIKCKIERYCERVGVK